MDGREPFISSLKSKFPEKQISYNSVGFIAKKEHLVPERYNNGAKGWVEEDRELIRVEVVESKEFKKIGKFTFLGLGNF